MDEITHKFRECPNTDLNLPKKLKKITYKECLEGDNKIEKTLKKRDIEIHETLRDIVDLEKQSNRILQNQKQVKAIYDEYSNLQKICEEKTQKELKIIPQLLFIENKGESRAQYWYPFDSLLFITLNIEKSKDFLSPKTKTFEESVRHELTHAIQFQNNKELLFYRKGLNSAYSTTNTKEELYDIRKAFSEGFATHIAGKSYTKHTKALNSIKQSEHLSPFSVDNYLKTLNKLSICLDDPYTFGSFIFQELEKLKGRQFVLRYAFKKSGFAPIDMQKDYNKICREQNKEPIQYIHTLIQIQKALSTHTAKHQLV